jgi:hypothetical protein
MMANEPESQKAEAAEVSKSRHIVVNRNIAVAALLGVAVLTAAVTYKVAYSVALTTCRRVLGQTRSCVVGGPNMPSELCTPGSATCGVKYCQLSSGTWTWESGCHAVP